jgi:hypothetical protein
MHKRLKWVEEEDFNVLPAVPNKKKKKKNRKIKKKNPTRLLIG